MTDIVTEPKWLTLARKEVGQREIPSNRGPAVQRYIDLSHCGQLGDPWCAIFVNAMLEASGVRGTRSPSSQSFRHSPLFKQLPGPALGALCVYWRGNIYGGLGHVGFYTRERDGYVWTLGGNEGDMVQEEAYPKNGRSFGLRGYWWPASEPLPDIRPIYAEATLPHVIGVPKVV